MIRKRTVLLALWAVGATLVAAPSALAVTHGGQGIWGPTSDKTITYTMFIIIGLVPLIIIVFSLIQGFLEHRKHARIDAAMRRAKSDQWKGGW
jgi:membrane protease YdiL (CAAX protease family)